MASRGRSRFEGDAEASLAHSGSESLGSLRGRHPGHHGNLGSVRRHHQ